MCDWYVLHVRTGKESEVVGSLARHLPHCKTMVPRRIMKERKNGRWKSIVRELFPGYVFVHTDMDAAMYYKLDGIPSVIKILGNDKGPQPVPENEMAHILWLHGSGDPLGISELHLEGGKITVISGPLAGMEGQIIRVDPRRQRAKVNISLMGQPRIIELSINAITKSEPRQC